MNKWVAFADVLKNPIRNGLTKPKVIRGEGVKMIAMGEIFAKARIADIEMDRVPVTEKEMTNCGIEEGDLLFARQSLVLEGAGKCSIVTEVTEPTVFESHLIRARIDENKADPYFVFYYFNSSHGRENVKTIVEQVAAAGIRGSDLVRLSIPCPDITEQRRIARILRDIDEKIENNNKINDNLQQQAAALFAQYYEQASKIVPFTSVIQILGGGTPKTGNPMFWNGSVPFFTPKDVGTPYTLTTEKTITEDGLAHCNSRLYPVNTVFVTARGTVGKVGMPGVPMAMNQSCYALVGKDIDQLMVYFYTLRTVQALKHKASGAVFDAITTRDFESETIRLIADDAAAEFMSVAAPMFGQILGNSIENQRLAELRDALLPRLMAGEIDVSDIDLSR